MYKVNVHSEDNCELCRKKREFLRSQSSGKTSPAVTKYPVHKVEEYEPEYEEEYEPDYEPEYEEE